MINQKILIIGGSGSLGKTLIKKYLNDNTLYIMSRDENKHWNLELEFNKHINLINLIGDFSDYNKTEEYILKYKPNYIIIASAMKHIDRCELDTYSSFKNNTEGMYNLQKFINKYKENLDYLQGICFVSTDKACNPISTYGICKALSEKISQNIAFNLKDTHIKCVNIRYGNVLDSRGSIIPILKTRIENGQPLFLTNENMTRFIMTLDQSVELIDYALNSGKNGETIVYDVPSMYIKDLLEIFCEKFNITYSLSEMRFVEKIHEELINETQSLFTYKNKHFYHIKPAFNNKFETKNPYILSSDKSIVSKEELKKIISNYL
jgi:UDP-N-acetylglucosamine 4,6-dehydratase